MHLILFLNITQLLRHYIRLLEQSFVMTSFYLNERAQMPQCYFTTPHGKAAHASCTGYAQIITIWLQAYGLLTAQFAADTFDLTLHLTVNKGG